MRRTLLPALLLMTATTAAQQQHPPGVDSITQAEMREDLTFLASDEMGGRLTDTPGNRRAAEWIAARFAQLKLKPIGDGGTYFQKYTLATAALGEGNKSSLGTFGTDWYPTRFSASATAKGTVAFVGFGITSKERNYDDYSDDVKGKIVLAIDHEPGERDENSIFDGVVTSQASDQLQKTLAAQARGAVGILFVSDVHNHPPGQGRGGRGNAQPPRQGLNINAAWPEQQPRIPRYMLGSWVEAVKIPAAVISRETAERLLEQGKAGGTLEALGEGSETKTGSKPIVLTGTNVELTTAVKRTMIDDRNVVAALEGSDPKLKDEVVIVCAHFDHDGTNGDTVLNGADDDGSGTVAVMEIAEAYAQAAAKGLRPKRTIVFAAWNSEERGLLGAWAYTRTPIYPLATTVGVLNMDMIGRNEEVPEGGGNRFRGLEVQTAASNENAVNIIGTVKFPAMKDLLARGNEGIDLTLRLRYDNNISQLMRRSDHWPFINNGVPAVWVHTGLHPDYHTATDDADRINYRKMEKITRLVYRASWMMGDR